MSFAKLISDLDGTHKQLKDVRLHQFSGSKSGSLQGEIYEDVTRDAPQFVATGDAHLDVLCSTTTPPPTLSVGQSPAVGVSVRGLRADAKFGLPGLATGAAHGFMASTDKAKLDAATATPTADALPKYDANGRLITSDAVAGKQAINWDVLQAQMALNQQGLAEKDPCRALFTTLPANSYNGTTKRITASANGALPASDGVSSWQVNDRVFFCGVIGTGAAQAGPYKIVQVGATGSPWILERTPDFGGPGAPAVQRLVGAKVQVLEGTDHGDTFWVCTNDTVTLDSTVLVFRKETAADVDGSTLDTNAAGNIQVKDNGLPNAKLTQVATATIKGRATAGSGNVEDLSATSAWGILASAAIGEGASNAYRGDRGKTAYDHSQLTNQNAHNTAYSQLTLIPAALDAIDGLTPAADRIAYYTGSNVAALTPLTAAARGLLDDADVETMRGTLGIPFAANGRIMFRNSASAGWSKIATLSNLTQYHHSFLRIDFAAGPNDTRRSSGTIYFSAHQANEMSASAAAPLLSVETSDNGGWSFGWTVDEDSVAAKRYSVWAYNASAYSVLIGDAQIIYDSARTTLYPGAAVVTTEPAGYTSVGGGNAAKTVGSIKVTGLTSGRIPSVDGGGLISDNAGLTFRTLSGITQFLALGDGTNSPRLELNGAAGVANGIRLQTASVNRWYVGYDYNIDFGVEALDADGVFIDEPISVPNAAGSAVVLGGAGAAKRPVKCTNLAGAGTRPVAVQADGTLVSGDSLTFKATIGNGSASSFTLVHGLGTADLQVSAIEVATGEPVGVAMAIDATNIVVTPGLVLPSNSLRILAQKV